MIINDLDDYYIIFDTKNRNTELDTLVGNYQLYTYKRAMFREQQLHNYCVLIHHAGFLEHSIYNTIDTY